jgi:thioredoxin reductase (NADPH)
VSAELLVVGAGPAGVSAALWARSLGIEVLLIDGASRPGGQLWQMEFQPINVAGVLEMGPVLAGRLARQLEAAQVAVRFGLLASALAFEVPDRPAVRTASGERLEASALLIATGVRRRRLGVPGDRELEGKGVSYDDRPQLHGGDVAVVGGGDAAFENALLLADAGCRVTLLVRGRARARAEFQQRAAAHPAIARRDGARVVGIEGEGKVRSVRVESSGGGVEAIPADAVVVKIGVQPNSEWCVDALDHDAEGYLRVDAAGATSRPHVWAAGDVTRPALFGVAVAAGQAALAVAAVRAILRP